MTAEPLAEEIPLNPADCETWIRGVSNRIARGVGVVTAAEREAKEKRRQFDLAYAMAYSRTEGPQHLRRYEADIASMSHRKEAEDSEIKFRHAERTSRALERELMAAMAINSNIRSMYGATGVGS